MEIPSDKNIMPEIKLFPVLDKVTDFIGKIVSVNTTELCLSEHIKTNTDT